MLSHNRRSGTMALALVAAAVAIVCLHSAHAYVVLTNSTVSPFIKLHSANGTAAVNTSTKAWSPPSLGAVNRTAEFLNRTLADVPAGICYREVATESLLLEDGYQHGHVLGNGSKPTLSRVQFCCDGFQQHPHMAMKCQPVCRDGCTNGVCAAPDKCRCLPDHVEIRAAGVCVATCPIGCENGVCSAAGACVCNSGYQLHADGKFCQPQCAHGCPNGNCTAPNVCVCQAGFQLSASGRCEPVCSRGCANGRCVAPERCACAEGYEMDAALSECRPVCQRGCTDGHCTAPNVCACSTGWTLHSSGNVCLPTCDRPCLGGRCVAPNQCDCAAGHQADSRNAFKCVPRCDNGCPNGVCTSPNFCLCEMGYVKDRKGVDPQMCIPLLKRSG